MRTKEKLIRESIARVGKRLAEIKELLDVSGLSRIREIRGEAIEAVKNYNGTALYDKIIKLHEEEKSIIEAEKKKQNTSKLIKERVELESELRELRNELYSQ